jgi:hypothetical protein
MTYTELLREIGEAPLDDVLDYLSKVDKPDGGVLRSLGRKLSSVRVPSELTQLNLRELEMRLPTADNVTKMILAWQGTLEQFDQHFRTVVMGMKINQFPNKAESKLIDEMYLGEKSIQRPTVNQLEAKYDMSVNQAQLLEFKNDLNKIRADINSALTQQRVNQPRERTNYPVNVNLDETNGLCWYHDRFGELAKKCVEPCKWTGIKPPPQAPSPTFRGPPRPQQRSQSQNSQFQSQGPPRAFPSEKVCYLCQGKGHVARLCPHKQKQQQRIENPTLRAFNQQVQGSSANPQVNNVLVSEVPTTQAVNMVNSILPMVMVDIDDRQTQCLIDTGASHCILQYKFFKYLINDDDRFTKPTVQIRAANGTEINCYGQKIVKVQLLGMSFHHNFFIADSEYCILGMDLLTEHQLSVEIQRKQINIWKRLGALSSLEATGQFNTVETQVTEEEDEKDKLVKLKIDQLRTACPEVFKDEITLKDDVAVEMRIDIKEADFRQPYIYEPPYAYREGCKTKIFELLEKGLLEPSASRYAHPVVCAPKKNGTIRVCGDYRAINKVTIEDRYIIPKIDYIKQNIRGRVFSIFDLREGFHQIPIRQEDRHKTAIATPWGLFQYKRQR